MNETYYMWYHREWTVSNNIKLNHILDLPKALVYKNLSLEISLLYKFIYDNFYKLICDVINFDTNTIRCDDFYIAEMQLININSLHFNINKITNITSDEVKKVLLLL